MRHRILYVTAALAACLPALALAQQAPYQHEHSFELSVGGGGTYLDWYVIRQVWVTNPNTNRVAPGAQVSLGYHLSRMWSVSLGMFGGYTSPATILQPFAALGWTPNVDARFSPFVTAGAGLTKVSWSGYRETSQFGVHLGAGLRMSLGPNLAVRLEGREQYEKYSDASVFPGPIFNGTGSLGISYFLGGRRIPVAMVAVTPSTASLASLSATEQLAATPMDASRRPLARRTVTWSSSNAAVATVSPAGLVTAVSNGTASITAASETASGTANVTVAQVATTLALTPPTATLNALGATQQLAASGQDANNNAVANPRVAWMSSNASAVTVSSSGLATAVGNGTATITASSAGGTAARATITVAQAVASVTVAPTAATVSAAGGTAQFTAQAADANGRPVTGKVVTWATSAPTVASLTPAGLATAVANGMSRITATVEGHTATATMTVTIPTRAAPAPVAVALPTAVNATVVLKSVNFRPNSFRLPPEATDELDAVVEAMKSFPTARWEIGGYTSSMGNAARNDALSRRRALAVRLYLIRHGIPSTRLVAHGYGPANPIASNSTVAGRRQNMRVEIKRLR